ncbi:hypothetical protein JG688_00014740 [Phytophthora aleatoria]|uniref:Transmembrane protein n=1 Tax=Phytophthora aleatoria TaxID=2496075 RepID=A0A8J5IFG9_9STRA|nr:hypothetical protein JG688_00014740 [Phytophthora aleatoria]
MTRVILEQFRISVPGLHIGSVQVLLMPVISSGGAVAFMLAMSSVIGFPLPFTLVVGILVWFVVLVLLRSIVVLICQVLLTFVYPAYLYGFISIEPANQKFYVMLLPIIKIIAKNWISYCLGNKFDLLPQIMIFNVDVFNALYVSSSMQASQSIMTVVQMVALDAVLAWVSISDIQHFMKTIFVLRRKIPAKHQLKNASFIEIAIQIIDEDPEARERLALRKYSLAHAVRRSIGTSTILVGGPLATETNERSSTSRRVLPADPPDLSEAVATATARNPSLKLVNAQKSLDKIFSEKERQRFLQYSARVLFTTEFIILVSTRK